MVKLLTDEDLRINAQAAAVARAVLSERVEEACWCEQVTRVGLRGLVAWVSCVVGLCLLAAPVASAAPGDFDSSFGSGGTAITQLGTGSGAFTSIDDAITDTQGRILVAGATGPPGGYQQELFVERYEPDGTLDTSFGTDGVFELAVKAETDVENGDLRLALQPNGDIVVASTASQGLAELFVARLTPNGSLDTSFNAAGTPGYVQQDVESYGSHTSAKATDADGVAVAPSTGDIWVDGDATFASSTDAFLYCLTSAGAACASDSAGTAYSLGGGSSPYSSAAGVMIQANGDVLVGLGAIDSSGDGEFGLAEFTSAGTLDASFANGGLALVYPGGAPQADSNFSPVRIAQAASQIVVLGFAGTTSGIAPLLMRFSSEGKLDTSFGSGGTVTFQVPGSGGYTYMNDLAVQPDGLLDLTGYSGNGSTQALTSSVVRLTAAGALDPSFGVGGVVTRQFSSVTDGDSYLFAGTLDSAGQLVVGGAETPSGASYAGVLARVFLDRPAASLTFSPSDPQVVCVDT